MRLDMRLINDISFRERMEELGESQGREQGDHRDVHKSMKTGRGFFSCPQA